MKIRWQYQLLKFSIVLALLAPYPLLWVLINPSHAWVYLGSLIIGTLSGSISTALFTPSPGESMDILLSGASDNINSHPEVHSAILSVEYKTLGSLTSAEANLDLSFEDGERTVIQVTGESFSGVVEELQPAFTRYAQVREAELAADADSS